MMKADLAAGFLFFAGSGGRVPMTTGNQLTKYFNWYEQLTSTY